jgi:hypothetical protein
MSSQHIYKICPKCSLSHTMPGIFCSRSCANSRTWSEKDKLKKSDASTKFWADNPAPNKGKPNPGKGMNIEKTFCYVSFCCVCSKLTKFSRKLTCSSKCTSLRRSSAIKIRLRTGRKFTKAGWYDSPTAGKVYLESSWEFEVAKSLDDNKIDWVRPKYLKYWLDGKRRMYYPDFYLPLFDCYLDPKNDYVRSLDERKLNAVLAEHEIKLILLNKLQLDWISIKKLI